MSALPDEPSFWSTVGEAIRGTKEELTKVPLRRAVILLAVPTVLEMSMESLFAIVDIFFVAKLGENAVATVGLTESMLSLVYALAMGIAAAATAIVSRRTGEQNPAAATKAAGQVIFLSIACAALVGSVGLVLAPHFLSVMGASKAVVETGSGYTAIMLGGSITIFLLFVINAIFRAAGDAVVAMRALWIANLLNIALAPCFIFGVGPIPRMGVAGAGIATTLSRGIGVGYQLLMLRGRSRLALGLHHLRPELRGVIEIVRIASSAAFQVLIETASWLALVRILSLYGSSALAGYTIAMRVAIFALLPPWGLANAAATLVGQNLGAGEPERARDSVITIRRYNMLFLGVIGALFALFPHVVVSLFTKDESVTAFAAECLRITAVGFVCFAYGMVTIQAFNGAGDTVTPMFINIGAFWLVKLPLAYGLARFAKLGPRGVFLAVTGAYTLQAVVAAIVFRRGAWQKTKIEG